MHATADGTLERNDAGWYEARCTCGFVMGPLPDLETTVDTLMDHAGDARTRAEDVSIRSIVNAGAGVEIHETADIQGPVTLGEHVKIGANVRIRLRDQLRRYGIRFYSRPAADRAEYVDWER